MVDSSQTRLAYITETVWGTTPTTPAFLNQRFTGESLNANIENAISNEIRADRNIGDLIQVGSEAGGNVDFEMSYASFEDWMESLMYNVWSTNVLKNGLIEKFFTLEKTFEAGATDQFHRTTGAIVNSLNLSMQTNSIVTGTFGFMGKALSAAQVIVTGATYTAVNSNPVMNAAADFASLAITGVTGPELTSLNLNITNNLRGQKVLGSLENRAIGTGRFEVTGDLTAYFENEELYDLLLSGTSADLAFKIGDASSKNYLFNVDKIKFETGEVLASGNDQDVMVNMTFRGLYEGTDNTLKITRTP